MNLRVGRSPFFIQRNKFTLSIRTVKSGSVSHFPFSILFCSAVLCCNIYSFLLCSVYFLAKKCPFLAKKSGALEEHTGFHQLLTPNS